ncbi:MAG: hypothetical protein QM699_11490 [Amaricoccus sp.]|uniref:hypothetical protein n=1 Tax=Amaricoccus sp. TaxID=1872485 RepID=UPI0039E3985F
MTGATVEMASSKASNLAGVGASSIRAARALCRRRHSFGPAARTREQLRTAIDLGFFALRSENLWIVRKSG